jgi:hypothetical protein
MRSRIVGMAVLAACVFGAAAPPSSAKTVWLCRPGLVPDPCTPGLSTTVYSPALKRIGVVHPTQIAHPAIDCFYVYPTVSGQRTGNANLHVDPAERDVARVQAGRYSQLCRIYAPMYRQVTLVGLIGQGSAPAHPGIALADVRAAFRTYLQKYNRGRGFVLIGHSQGTFMLRQLIAKDVDPRPSVRLGLLSAILLGGNVLVRQGRDIGGDFRQIPACRSATQLGCVIAFSTFDEPVPPGSIFGRPLPALGSKTHTGDAVLCTNPAALGGGAGRLDPIFQSGGIGALGSSPPPASTVWASVPRSYRAFCSMANNANVLQIAPLSRAPKPPEVLGPTWGLHLLDANIALGNLVSIVSTEARAFAASRG